MAIRGDIEKICASLAHSPWMENLTAALDNEIDVALIVGTVDNCALIRDMYGLISLDQVFPAIYKLLHQRFGNYSVWWEAVFPYFLILLTGDEAKNAIGIGESIRATVEATAFDERFNITMHFGVTEASPNWGTAGRLRGLLNAADAAIEIGKQKAVTNRVYAPTSSISYKGTFMKRP
jgi:GGDEF domain-containing protein